MVVNPRVRVQLLQSQIHAVPVALGQASVGIFSPDPGQHRPDAEQQQQPGSHPFSQCMCGWMSECEREKEAPLRWSTPSSQRSRRKHVLLWLHRWACGNYLFTNPRVPVRLRKRNQANDPAGNHPNKAFSSGTRSKDGYYLTGELIHLGPWLRRQECGSLTGTVFSPCVWLMSWLMKQV